MGSIVIITAPSAAGKTTLIKKYMSLHKEAEFSVSHTSREKRKNEVHGKDYYFITKEDFKNMIDNSEFIEWAEVHGDFYGTSVNEIKKSEDSGKLLILDIDVQGALYLKSKGVKANYIFISPPSIEEIKRRLLERKTETEETLERRIFDAKREMEYIKEFDVVIINDDLEKSYKELEEAIIKYTNKN